MLFISYSIFQYIQGDWVGQLMESVIIGEKRTVLPNFMEPSALLEGCG